MSQTVRAERRNISYSDEIHRRYQNNTYIPGCYDGKHIEDYWNVDGKELLDAWTGFTRFVLLKERPPEGYTWSGRRLTRKQKDSRPDDVWPDMWNFVSDAAKKKAKQKWAIEKPKLDNARQLKGIFCFEPNDEEFKLTMIAARRKLEVPLQAAMPCKIPTKSSGETHRNIGKRKTQYACVVDADESTRPRLEGAWTQTSSRSHFCKRDEFCNS